MGMSTYAIGFVPPDEEFQRKLKAFKALRDANVDIPQELWDYFGGDEPDPAGLEVSLGDAKSEYSDEWREGIEIDVSKLDPKIKTIRFLNSW